MAVNEKKGFSLIEMAFVLIIVSIILGMGTGLYVTFVKWNKKKTTSETLKKLSTNVIGCLSSNDEGFDTFPVTGTKDAYLQNVVFIGSEKLKKDFLSSHNATVCDVKNSELSFKDEYANSTINNVAFVLFSKGEDYQSDTYCNSTKVENNTFCSGVVKGNSSKDLYAVVTLDEVKNHIGCLDNPIRFFPLYLPVGVVGESYSASITASGGIKPYNWCYSGKLPNGISISPNSVCPSYQQADEINLSGTPNSAGNSKITVCVKDSNSPEPYSRCMEFAITVNLLSGNGTGNSSNMSNCTNFKLHVFAENKSITSVKYHYSFMSLHNGISIISISGHLGAGDTFSRIENLVYPDDSISFKVDNKGFSGEAKQLDPNGDCDIEMRCIVPEDYPSSEVSCSNK